MNWRVFRLGSQTIKKVFKIWTLYSETDSNYLDWSQQNKTKNNDSILNGIMKIMKFTSLFSGPRQPDVLIRSVCQSLLCSGGGDLQFCFLTLCCTTTNNRTSFQCHFCFRAAEGKRCFHCVCVCLWLFCRYTVRCKGTTSGFKDRQKHFQADFSAQNMKLGQIKRSVQAVDENKGARIWN